MNAQNCLDILREIKDVAIATVDDEGKPQVRIIDVMIVEKDKLYFCTGRGKDFYRQLMKRPDVAVTGLNEDFQMVRLSGKAEKLADQKHWIDRIFEENPVMNGVYPRSASAAGNWNSLISGKTRFIGKASCLAVRRLREKHRRIREKRHKFVMHRVKRVF